MRLVREVESLQYYPHTCRMERRGAFALWVWQVTAEIVTNGGMYYPEGQPRVVGAH